MKRLRDIVEALDNTDFEPEVRLRRGTLAAVLAEVLFHANERYWQFTPAQGVDRSFEERLENWVANPTLSEADVAILLRTIPHIQFVDRDDLLTLYRGALSGTISRWVMDRLDLMFGLGPREVSEAMAVGFRETWFCPVTDSMNIAEFLHINQLSGQEFRPAWRTLRKFGTIEKIEEYMSANSLTRLVLLEDFVGSGRQAIPVLRFVVENFCRHIPVLFVPLIISAFGLQRIVDKLGNPENLWIESPFVIPEHAHVRQEPEQGEPYWVDQLRDLVLRTFELVRPPLPPEVRPLYEAFGFESVGTLLVLCTNCPNNTLPLIWHQSPSWQPLFKRVSRS